MIILLAPPRSGSSAATNILKHVHPDVIKAHYAKYDNTDPDNEKLNFDNGRLVVSTRDISMIYYQWRPSLECCISFSIFNKYQELQTEKIYSDWLNSSEGIYNIFESLQIYWQFGVMPFRNSDVANKLVLNYSFMAADPVAYAAAIPDYVLSESEISRKQFNKLVLETLEVTENQKTTDPNDARLLSSSDITPKELLDQNTLLILKNLCRNTFAETATKEIDACLKAKGVEFGPIVTP
tara:strand:+ start:690 stop:1403 length:714 start_codon:yes stop_codon:yes gene_type:complete